MEPRYNANHQQIPPSISRADADAKMSRAHYQVAKAIRKGELIRPSSCEQCDDEPLPNRRGAAQIQAHHPNGYDNPFDVQWLCPRCHRLENLKPYLALPTGPDPLGSILDD